MTTDVVIGRNNLCVSDFFLNPSSLLISIKCTPHNTAGGLLLGDSAHAMVPFYGQGMNCGFEDCLIFMDLLEKNGFSFNEAAREYSTTRCTDTHAICELAMYNYIEMRSYDNNWSYLVKKKIDVSSIV